MPSNYIRSRAAEDDRVLRHRELAAQGRVVTNHALRADRSRETSGQVHLELQQHETRHTEFRNISALRIVSYYIAVAVLVCILLIDILLFGPTAEFIGSMSSKYTKLVTTILKIAIPIAIVGFELYTAMQVYEARHGDPGVEQERSRRRLWLFIAITFAIVMPVLVIASHPSTATALVSGRLATLLRFQLVAFVALAFATHVGVLFSGRIGHESKAYFIFSAKRRQLRQQVREADRNFEAAAQAAGHEFNEYLLLNDEYVRHFPGESRAHWNFDQITIELINERFGRVMIQAPDNNPNTLNTNGARPPHNGGPPNSSGPAAPTPAPAPPIEQTETNSGNDDGETDYLRTIVRGSIREADSEARP